MSHTNSTTNYNLPQFITTDKPAWLTDINNAYLAIDTGMNAAKTAADNAQGDATQALSDAGDAATAAAAADAKGAGAVASIADTFDPSSIYAVGSLVIYNNLFYVCTVAVITPGPWSGSANWDRITVKDLYDELKTEMKNTNILTAGDSLALTNLIVAGFITSSGSRLQFFIPSAKVLDLDNINSVAISGSTLRVYASDGSDTIAIADGTWSYTRRENGVLCTFDLDTAITRSGNISIYFNTVPSLAFS